MGIYPSKLKNGIVKLVKFVVGVYAPSWFEIKASSKFQDKPEYIFLQIQGIKNLKEPNMTKILMNKLKFNAFGLCQRTCCIAC